MNKDNQTARRKLTHLTKKFIIGFVALVFIVYFFVWIFSPILANWQINKNLSRFNLQLSEGTSIRLNPFLLKVSIFDLQLVKPEKNSPVATIGQAEIDINAFALFSNQIDIEKFSVERVELAAIVDHETTEIAGLELQISDTEQETQIEDKPKPKSEPEPEPKSEPKSEAKINAAAKRNQEQTNWRVISDSLDLKSFAIQLTHFNQRHLLQIKRLTIGDFVASDASQKANIQIDALLNDSPINISSDILISKINSVAEGKIKTEFSAGQVDLSKFAYLIQEQAKLESGNASLKFSHDFQIKKAGIDTFVSAFEFSLNEIKAESNGIQLAFDEFNQQTSGIAIDVHDNTLGLDLKNLNITLKNLTLNPHDSLNNIAKIEVIELLNGSINLTGNQPVKLSSDSINISQALFSERIKHSNEVALPKLAGFEALSLENIQLSNNHLLMEKLSINNLVSDVILNHERAIENLVLPKVKPDNPPTKDVDVEQQQASLEEAANESLKEKDNIQNSNDKIVENDTNPPFMVTLKELVISDNSRLSFIDRSVSPEFNQSIELKQFQMNNIDSQQSNSVTSFDLLLKTDAFAETALTGDITPFSDKLNLNLKGQVKEFSLPKVSPYLKDAMGFEMLSGHFDTDINLAIKNDEIDGETQLNVRGLELSSADDKSEETDNQQSTTGAMPLNTALGMLQDDNGNLELDIPLSGNVSDPDFGLTNFVALVSKKAIMAAAQSYLLETFVPYANVLSVVMTAGEYMLEVNIEPLNYQATQIDLHPDQMNYVNQLIQLLKDQPESQIKVCSIASILDMPNEPVNLDNQDYINRLNQLSEKRAQSFKLWMVEQGGIESARLLICQPQFDKEPANLPRIEFEI